MDRSEDGNIVESSDDYRRSYRLSLDHQPNSLRILVKEAEPLDALCHGLSATQK